MASSSSVNTQSSWSLARNADSTLSPTLIFVGSRSLWYPSSELATATFRLPVLSNTFQHAMTLYHVKMDGKNTRPKTMTTVITLPNRCLIS